MAKILAPYSLCPLIEHRNFLGVSDDALNDCVIVTLSRNMVIRFRLSDQKQLSSWSTRYKLTAPVVYDFFNNHFIGVFNCDEISFWKDSLEELNKLKKYKFTWLIHSIVSSKQLSPHIVYLNGCIAPLNIDTESRKQPTGDFLSTSEDIQEVKIVSIFDHIYISLLTLSEKDEKYLYFVPTADGKEKISIKLSQEKKDVKIVSHTIIESELSTCLITLWSNGELNSFELPPEEADLPGRLIGKIDFISLSTEPSLFPISGEQIAIYGSTPNGEGGIIAIYSVKFGVVETSDKFKIYNKITKSLTRCRELIIPSGSNLLVLPYKLHRTRLAGLIGSQAATVTGDFDRLCDQGVPESRICENLLPELIEAKRSKEVLHILQNCHEIPDKVLVTILSFALSSEPTEISELLIEKILTKPLVGDGTSLSFIRAHIPLDSALILLKKLQELISDCPGSSIPIEWTCLLLDSHYQQYLLSKDTKVIETIRQVNKTIQNQLEYMEELKFLKWEMDNSAFKKRKKPLNSPHKYVVKPLQTY